MSTLNDLLQERNDLLDQMRNILSWAESRDGTPETDEANLRKIVELAKGSLGIDSEAE